jgi:hypothetical protein
MRGCIAIVSVCLLLLGGCGKGYKIVEASGTVTLDGKPLSGAYIYTQPVGGKETPLPGPGSMAKTDSEGHVALEFQHEATVGAVPGKCLVKIREGSSTPKESSDDTVDNSLLRSQVPGEYQEGTVEYTIPDEGTETMNFELKSERPQ